MIFVKKIFEKWNMMLNEINLGEMPPRDEPQLSKDDRRILVNWINENLDADNSLRIFSLTSSSSSRLHNVYA